MSAPRPDLLMVMHDLRGGGAERVSLELARGVVVAGRSVRLVRLGAGGDYPIPAGVDSVCLDVGHVRNGVLRLAREISHTRPRAILAALTHVNLVAIAAARLARHDGVLAVVEHNSMSAKRTRARRLGDAFSYRLAGALYRFADKVVAVSAGVAEDLRGHIRFRGDQLVVLDNPVITPALAEAAAAPLEDPWVDAERTPLIVAAGRLHPQKDFPCLLDAFAALRRRLPVRLVILGEGEERAALEAQIAALGVGAHVRLAGFVRNPYPYFKRGAVFVLSSRWEGMPTVLIEAMACGAAVVATDCPSGPRELLADGAHGYLTPIGDRAALARAIEAAIAAPRTPDRSKLARFETARAADAYLQMLEI